MMKLSSLVARALALLFAIALTGCVTQSAKLPPPAIENPGSPMPPLPTATAQPLAASKGSPTAVANPVVTSLPGPGSTTPSSLSVEAAEFVARFTQPAGSSGALPHALVDTTSFPESIKSLQPGAQAPKFEYLKPSRTVAPVEGLTADGNSTQLIVRDWTGLVLVPISTSLSVAHTSNVRLLKVEAHPLNDGRVRIWIRVQNPGQRQLASEVACAFRMQTEGPVATPYFYELQVPGQEFRDVFFVSPEGKLNTYTVLVRQGR